MSGRLEAAFLERTWVGLKQNNRLYFVSKIISIIVATTCAVITIWLRSQVKPKEVVCATEDYRFIFWMLYVFFAFQSLSEIYEVFLVLNQNAEKGIIGLLFELNYFCGVYVTYRVVQAIFRSPDCVNTAPTMYLWLLLQTCLFFLCVLLSL